MVSWTVSRANARNVSFFYPLLWPIYVFNSVVNTILPVSRLLWIKKTLEWFSKRTGTLFQNGARSKNVDKKLGRERRRVVLKDVAVVATRIITSAF